MQPTDRQLVRVAVPVPLAETFDYVLPPGEPVPKPGCRVRVPFGRGEQVGVVVEHPAESPLPAEKVKPLHEVLDRDPAIGNELLQTLRWAAEYYHHPLGAVLSHALPSYLRAGRPLGTEPEPVWRITELGLSQPLDRLSQSARLQASALAYLRAGERTRRELRAEGIAPSTLMRLAEKGWVEAVAGPITEWPSVLQASLPALTADQSRVLERIERDTSVRPGFLPYLLHGVTGSGKTEIYLRLTAQALAVGRQTLMLVPEIGLTPQLVQRLTERFGSVLAILHSALTERERFEAWRRVLLREAAVVVGTRSAVFAPLVDAGLVIVDEEHDLSYKQQSGFRYSARDLAVVRAQRLGVPIVLGSATPSLETYYNALQGRYQKLDLPQRIGAAGVPELRIIDLNRHASRQGLSTPLVAAIGTHLKAGNQVLLFLNRRGFAPALFCPSCHSTDQCLRCDARMTVHAHDGVVRCHHCGAERALTWACPRCGAQRVAVGAGTQRVDAELATLYPRARIARIDRDSTSRKGTLAGMLGDVAAGEVDILVGTQMLTKGHDFPRVTLVGVLSADQGLFGTDPRSHERLAQTLLQVAGRAGRADRPGEVLIQTHYPDHPLLARLVTRDYAAFAELALAERREAHWPPFSYLAAWHAEATQRELAFAFLERVRAASSGHVDVETLGPAAQVMERKEGRYRAVLLMRSAQRTPLHLAVTQALERVRSSAEARKVRWSLDIDPLEI
jgi:primosomal protein N' (replication factor Y) (superfamily II helicase)